MLGEDQIAQIRYIARLQSFGDHNMMLISRDLHDLLSESFKAMDLPAYEEIVIDEEFDSGMPRIVLYRDETGAIAVKFGEEEERGLVELDAFTISYIFFSITDRWIGDLGPEAEKIAEMVRFDWAGG